MRVLITGASGFTGRYLVDALTAADHLPIPLTVDLTDANAVDDAVKASAADAIAHLAARSFVASSDFGSFYQVNQLGTFHLLDAAARHLPGSTVLIASSATVYGVGSDTYLNEASPLRPVNHYAISKYAMELGARLWEDRLQILIVRPFNYTGVGQDERFLIPKIISHFRAREPVIELGNIDVSRDFGDVRSVADAYVTLLDGLRVVDPVNICTGETRSIREILAIASRESGHELEIRLNPAFIRSQEIESLGGDNSRLRQLAPDWRPIPIEQTISWMLTA